MHLSVQNSLIDKVKLLWIRNYGEWNLMGNWPVLSANGAPANWPDLRCWGVAGRLLVGDQEPPLLRMIHLSLSWSLCLELRRVPLSVSIVSSTKLLCENLRIKLEIRPKKTAALLTDQLSYWMQKYKSAL